MGATGRLGTGTRSLGSPSVNSRPSKMNTVKCGFQQCHSGVDRDRFFKNELLGPGSDVVPFRNSSLAEPSTPLCQLLWRGDPPCSHDRSQNVPALSDGPCCPPPRNSNSCTRLAAFSNHSNTWASWPAAAHINGTFNGDHRCWRIALGTRSPRCTKLVRQVPNQPKPVSCFSGCGSHCWRGCFSGQPRLGSGFQINHNLLWHFRSVVSQDSVSDSDQTMPQTDSLLEWEKRAASLIGTPTLCSRGDLRTGHLLLETSRHRRLGSRSK